MPDHGPRCQADRVVKNGVNSAGTQTFRCRGCGRRFVESPRKGPVAAPVQALVEALLRERLALRAISRATGLSRSWVQRFANTLFRDRTPWTPGPVPKKRAD
jgi:transposase-like protein